MNMISKSKKAATKKKKLNSSRKNALINASEILGKKYGELDTVEWLVKDEGIIEFSYNTDENAGLYSTRTNKVLFTPMKLFDFKNEKSLELIAYFKDGILKGYITYDGKDIFKSGCLGTATKRFSNNVFQIETFPPPDKKNIEKHLAQHGFNLPENEIFLYTPVHLISGKSSSNINGVLVKGIENIEIEKKNILKITLKDQSIGYFDLEKLDWLL